MAKDDYDDRYLGALNPRFRLGEEGFERFEPGKPPSEPQKKIESVSQIVFITVQSSNLDGVYYDYQRRELFVMFKNNSSSIFNTQQRVYKYYDVPSSAYHELMSAPSHGTYFHDHIRTSYRYERMQ